MAQDVQTPTAELTVVLSASFGAAYRTSYLFATLDAANEAMVAIEAAAKAYVNRTNDREKYFAFDHLVGRASLDVGQLLGVDTSEPFGEKAEIYADWGRRCRELHKSSDTSQTPSS